MLLKMRFYVCAYLVSNVLSNILLLHDGIQTCKKVDDFLLNTVLYIRVSLKLNLLILMDPVVQSIVSLTSWLTGHLI